MTVLVINSGSSSMKYQLVDPVAGTALATGLIDRIGEATSTVTHTVGGSADGSTTTREQPVADHDEALRVALSLFDDVGPRLADADVRAVGHRVVHGGSVFFRPTLIDDDVVRQIDDLSPLAPLHNPANARGIVVARELLPDVPHVAVFDTAFFHTLPEAAATYALDREVAKAHGIRRYGFHGTSHQYVSQTVAEVLDRPLGDLHQIVLHLGNGASASAVRGGEAVETSMGMTPLEGLVMGTRTGDIDPAVVFYLARSAGLSIDELDDLFNKESGLKGLSGENDYRALRRLIEAGDEDAQLAFDVYVHRLRKYVGAYLAVLGRVDVIAFTAGVGENAPLVRATALAGLEGLGIAVDAERNVMPGGGSGASGGSSDGQHPSGARIISPDGASTVVMVVPTNEELAIARQCVELVDR